MTPFWPIFWPLFGPFLDTRIPILCIHGRNMGYLFYRTAGFGYGYFRTWEKRSKGVKKGVKKGPNPTFGNSKKDGFLGPFLDWKSVFLGYVLFLIEGFIVVFLFLTFLKKHPILCHFGFLPIFNPFLERFFIELNILKKPFFQHGKNTVFMVKNRCF